MLLVVAYDVADDTRRVRLHTFLLGSCDAVQESVFECELSEGQARKLKQGVRRLLRAAVDRVRYYRLCVSCVGEIEDLHGPVTRAAPTALVV
jgi:CRISPR-associated protein Cas2